MRAKQTKPTRTQIKVGDTVVITGRPLKWLGYRGIVTDLYYLPASRRKGYYDYAARIELVGTPYPHTVAVQSGNFRKETDIPEGFFEGRKEHLQELEAAAAARRKDRKLERAAIEAAGYHFTVPVEPKESYEDWKLRNRLVAREIVAGGRKAAAELERAGIIHRVYSTREWLQNLSMQE